MEFSAGTKGNVKLLPAEIHTPLELQHSSVGNGWMGCSGCATEVLEDIPWPNGVLAKKF